MKRKRVRVAGIIGAGGGNDVIILIFIAADLLKLQLPRCMVTTSGWQETRTKKKNVGDGESFFYNEKKDIRLMTSAFIFFVLFTIPYFSTEIF